MYALHFVGWEEWIKGETHSGKDISGGKVGLLNWSILNEINDEFVRVCRCVPLFTQCGMKQGVTSLTKTRKLHRSANISTSLGPLKTVLVPTPP